MTTAFLDYPLNNGYLHHWLAAGPVAAPVALTRADLRAGGGDLEIIRRHQQEQSGVSQDVVDNGPLHPDGPVWRYVACRDDHFVEMSAHLSVYSHLRSWAFTQLRVDADQDVSLVVTSFGPFDVWLNGHHLARHEFLERLTPRSVSVPASLTAGSNDLLLRFENAGARDVAHALAVRVVGLAGGDARIAIPTSIEPDLLKKRAEAERLINNATLDRYVYGYLGGDHYHKNQPITLRFGDDLDVSFDATYRLQGLNGSIFQEATKKPEPGMQLELARTFPLWNGPHHLALAPVAHEYFQKLLRVERKDLFHVVRSPYGQEANPDAAARRNEALDDAAQRRNDSLYCEIAKMALGRHDKVKLKPVQRAIEGIRQRADGSVVDLLGILALLLRGGEPAKTLEALQPDMQAAILTYRYSADDGDGDFALDGMDFESESRQLLFSASELLAGQLLPTAEFAASGQAGAWHQQRAEARLVSWLRQRGQYGFEEWDSPECVEANLAALATLADLAESEPVTELAAVLMDKIFFSLAVNAYRGAYGSSRGRTDTAAVLSARLEATSGICRLMWGQGNYHEALAGVVSLALCQNYELPNPIGKIAADTLDAFWSQERQARPTGAQAENGWQVNKVTYKTQDYMLSCAQDYKPGQPGSREHIWQATLGPDAVVFVNHPACLHERDGRAPSLWAGNAVLPRAAQWGDVLIALHKLPPDDWLGFTHAYFPAAAFDEVDFSGKWAFARSGAGYLALTASGGLERIQRGPTAHRELRSHGAETVWLCHMGQALLDGSFDQFKAKVLAMELAIDGLSVSLTSLRGEALAFDWSGPLLINGEAQALADYRHFENPYCVADLPADALEIVVAGEGVRLEFE